MNIWVPIVVAFIAAVGGMSGTLYATRRQNSGRIDTSPAQTLWEASEKLREEYRNEVASLRAEVVALRADSAADRAEIRSLNDRVRVLQAEVEAYRYREATGG